MGVIKRFLEWIRLKDKLHYFENNRPEFSEGEVWWCYIGENIGSEISGKSKNFTRPVLIVKKFSRNLFLGFPTSTQKQKIQIWSVPISINNVESWVILSQIRVFDAKRLKTRMETVGPHTLLNVKRAFEKLFL